MLSTPVVLFPLWLALWNQAPLTPEQLDCPGKVSIREEQLALLRQSFGGCGEGLRFALAKELAAVPAPAARRLFAELLGRERSPGLQADMIRMIPRIGLPETDLAPFLASPSELVAEAALHVLAGQRRLTLDQIRGFLSGQAAPPSLRRAAWDALAAGTVAGEPDWELLKVARTDPDERIRAAGLQAACLLQPRPPQVDRWLDEAAEGAPALRLAAASDPLPDSGARLEKLMRDPLAAVRVGLCRRRHGRFREVFLGALGDRDPAVRCAAAGALSGGGGLGEDGFRRLAAALEDPDCTVQAAAEAALLALCRGSRTAYLPAVRRLLAGTPIGGGAAALFRILAEMRDAQGVPLALETLRGKGFPPETLAAALGLLAAAAPENSCAREVLPLASHGSPRVRAAVAAACGRLRLDGSVPALKTLCRPDQPPFVREEAYLAMGLHPQAEFAADLLACLRNVSGTSRRERAVAAWAAGRLRTVPATAAVHLALARRLQRHCLQPVLPGMMPMFDDLSVIANAMISLAMMKKSQGGAYEAVFQAVQDCYLVPIAMLDRLSAGGGAPIPRSPVTCDLAYQVRRFLDGKSPAPLEAPESFPPFSLCPIERTDAADR